MVSKHHGSTACGKDQEDGADGSGSRGLGASTLACDGASRGAHLWDRERDRATFWETNIANWKITIFNK